MSSTPHDPFYSSPFGPFYRRHTPYMVQPEYRIYEMNKRLQSRTEVSSSSLRLRRKAQDPQVLEQLSKNITRMGLTSFTLNYLREHKNKSQLASFVLEEDVSYQEYYDFPK
ncbi:LDB2 protein, partial [Polypterus senegalus]